MSMLQALQTRAAPFVALRHDLHRHPELGLQEFRTSELLASQLQSWGYSVTRGLAANAWACGPTWTRCPSTRPMTCHTAACTRA